MRRAANVAAWHTETLAPWIGDRTLEEVHDETLQPFKEHRLNEDKVSLTTVNRAVEIVRRILNLAARVWRHPNGMTWLTKYRRRFRKRQWPHERLLKEGAVADIRPYCRLWPAVPANVGFKERSAMAACGRDDLFADVAESCRSEPPRERRTTAVGMRGELTVPATTGPSRTSASPPSNSAADPSRSSTGARQPGRMATSGASWMPNSRMARSGSSRQAIRRFS